MNRARLSLPRAPISPQCRRYAKPVGESGWPGFKVTRKRARPDAEVRQTPFTPPEPPAPLPGMSTPPSEPKAQQPAPATGPVPVTKPTPVPFSRLYQPATRDFRTVFLDETLPSPPEWWRIYATAGKARFPKQVEERLKGGWEEKDLVVRGDTGWVYLREEKYSQILDSAFGKDGWLLAPRGPTTLTSTTISQPFVLLALDQFISEARGSFTPPPGRGIPANPATDPTVRRTVRYEALVRCCKDLGVAWQLWDKQWVSKWRRENCRKVWVNNVPGSLGGSDWAMEGKEKGRYVWRLKREMEAFGIFE